MSDVMNRLSPNALSAAMRGGMDGWGRWSSAAEHVRYMEAVDRHDRHRRMCRCGCRKRITHRGFANGICLMSGCELTVLRWVKTGR